MWISELGKLRQTDHGLQASLNLIQKTPAAICFIPTYAELPNSLLSSSVSVMILSVWMGEHST